MISAEVPTSEIAGLRNDQLKVVAMFGHSDAKVEAVRELYRRLEAALNQIKP